MKKRVLAIVLAAVMVFALLPAAALAADSDLPKLSAPSKLRWDTSKPGMIFWETNGQFQSRVRVCFYKIGETKPVYTTLYNLSGNHSSSFNMSSFMYECAGNGKGDWDAGNYYFTVQNLGDGIEYSDSNVVSSQELENGIYAYIKPEAKLPTPVQAGTWNWPAAIWADEQNANKQISSYWIEYGFSEGKIDPGTNPDSIKTIGGSSNGHSGMSNSWLQDRLIGQHGNGYYYFRVRPLSSNVEEIRNGDYSPWSEGYNLREASLNVKNKLENMGNSSAESILNGVQDMNTTELYNAMRADLENKQSGTVSALEALEKKAGGPASVAVDETVSEIFEPDQISIVGASLNKENANDPAVTLNIGRADPKDIRDEMYNSTVAINFSMELENVKNAHNLDVPVKITMPIPDTINPDFLVILHYRQDGTVEEVFTNCYQENGKWYVSYVLTSFSDFVMTMTAQSQQPSTNLPTVVPIPTTGTAKNTTQTVQVDGKAVTFECYALKDEKGNLTNYIKLRDLANILNGTAAQFQVGWDGKVSITSGTAYTPNGTENSTPFSGDRAYTASTDPIRFNGQDVAMTAFILKDDKGGGYTYFKLRDLGQLLNFYVGWDAATGVSIDTSKPYSAN